MITLKILIVDDDKTLCSNLKKFFERENYHVETAHDAKTAMNLLASFQPDLLLLDVHLPESSGITILSDVKERFPAVRVIIMTGESDKEYERKARVLGADDFIVKPFTLEYLQHDVLEKLQRNALRELKATFHELGIEREKMQLLFDQIQEGVILLDPQGLLLIVNRAARTLLGLPEELSGTTILGILGKYKVSAMPVPRGQVVKNLEKNPFEDIATQHGEPFDLERQDPPGLILECRINPLRSSQGSTEGSVVIFHDVTDQRRSLGAMKRLVSVLTHKFRTPLMSMIGYPRLLLNSAFGDNSNLTEGQQKALDSILQNSLRLDDTINQLVGYTSLDPTELELKDIPLEELIATALTRAGAEVPKCLVATRIDESVKGVVLRVDPLRARLAFENLIENAFKFRASELNIKVKTRTPEYVTIDFIDDGRGMGPEHLARVFEEFYQVDPHFTGQNPGTGLGLTVVKEIIEAHGGKIWVESVIRQGSTFHVQLPAAKQGASHA